MLTTPADVNNRRCLDRWFHDDLVLNPIINHPFYRWIIITIHWLSNWLLINQSIHSSKLKCELRGPGCVGRGWRRRRRYAAKSRRCRPMKTSAVSVDVASASQRPPLTTASTTSMVTFLAVAVVPGTVEEHIVHLLLSTDIYPLVSFGG